MKTYTADPKELVANRKKIVEDMQDKQGYISCEKCFKSSAYKFEVHHIMFRSRFPKHPMLHDPINLIILCDKCHKDCHTNPEENEKLIDDRNLKEIFIK